MSTTQKQSWVHFFGQNPNDYTGLCLKCGGNSRISKIMATDKFMALDCFLKVPGIQKRGVLCQRDGGNPRAIFLLRRGNNRCENADLQLRSVR
jgi:hypothetical protein